MRAIQRRGDRSYLRRRTESMASLRLDATDNYRHQIYSHGEFRISMKVTCHILLYLMIVLSSPFVLALLAFGQSSTHGSSIPDLSGFWQLKFDSENVPPAILTSSAAQADPEAQYRHDIYAVRWCNHIGMPAMMETSSSIDIRQGHTEIAIVSEAVSAARHIYMDGQGHPKMETYDPQSNGHSIGQWEGDTLVVDTIGFSDRGITSIPGGGIRTPDSHLTERYRLLDGGSILSVVFAWEDPQIFLKPHIYEFRYSRAPSETYAREYLCDSSNGERAKFLSGSPGSEPASR
jgi:hypothetical protein